MDPADETIHTIHSIWSAALTLLGGVGTMFIKNLREDIRGKADKDDVDEKHRDNVKRFDKLDATLEKLDTTLEKIGETVAVLKDRAGMGNGKVR